MNTTRPTPHANMTKPEITAPPRKSVSSRARSERLSVDNSQYSHTAHYIAEMSGEMAVMADGAGLKLVAHFLSMARAEAEDAADRAP